MEAHPGIKGIILFAASKAVGESVQQPLKYYRNNIVTLVNLLEMMPEFNIEGIVFLFLLYGIRTTGPGELAGNRECPDQTRYVSLWKHEADQRGDYPGYDPRRSAFQSIILRYFNPIGAHPSAEIGELPNGVPQNLIPYLTQTAMGIRKELSVFGDDYDTADGSCIRDYINVVDLAKATCNRYGPYA